MNDETVNAYYNAEYYSSRVGPSVNFINNLSLALITVFGAILFMQGKMSVGNISSFVLYSRKFSGPINEIITSSASCNRLWLRQSGCSVCWTNSRKRPIPPRPSLFTTLREMWNFRM